MKLSKKKRKSEKAYYTIMKVPSVPNKNVKYRKVGMKLHRNLVVFNIIMTIVLVVGLVFTIKELIIPGFENASLKEENERLTLENKELEEKVELLSVTVNQKAKEEKEVEEANIAESIPTGFPLNGASTMEEDTIIKAIILTASSDIKVVATGEGEVIAIEEDEDSNKVITIMHEEGYESIYTCSQSEEVTMGQSVDRGTILFEVNTGKEVIYQIKLNDEYIMPFDVMDIEG